MRKLLYGTTALATAGLIVSAAGDATAAERIKLGIAGFHHQYVVGLGQNFRDTDSGRTNRGFTELPIDQKSNTEICFTGSTKLDNGITVGVQVEMEAMTRTVSNNVGRHIDESWLFLQSPSLGQLKLGIEDPASELLHFVNPNGGISVDDGDVINVAFYTVTNGQNNTVINTTSIGDAVGDANSITYITPRWYGFQLGVSYIPIAEDSVSDPSGQTPQFGDRSNNGTNRWHSGVSAGGNFQHTFDGGLGIGIKAGLLYMQESEDNKSTGKGGDVTGYDVVGRISYGGFTLGGGFKQLTSGHRYPVTTNTNTRTAFSERGYAAGGGVSYETGPYKIGADCVFGEQVGDIRAGTGDIDHLNCAFSGSYTLGPGIRLVGGVFFFNDGAENALNAGQREANAAADAAIRNTSSTNGVGGVIGITTSF